MDKERLASWLEGYGRAWERQDADAAVALFTADATCQEKPFDEPMRGREAIREYWATGGEYQHDIAFGYDILTVDPAVVHWWASYTVTETGEPTKLDGIFLLEFDGEGFCTSLREWWHAHPRPSF